MKHPQIKFSSFTPATDVLEAFLAQGRKMSPMLALIECKQIVEKMVKERAKALILPQIEDAVEAHLLIHDTYEGSQDQEAWTDAMDDAIEALLDAYSDSVTQDFIGRYCVSTRFHLETPKGAKPETVVLADAFANDVWRVLVHDHDPDAEPPRVLSTAKIMAAVGVTQDDLAEIMGDMPATTTQAPQEKVMDHRTTNEVLNKLYEFWGGEYPAELKDYWEMAIDLDDGIALSGCVPLGIELEDAKVLRLAFVKQFDEFETALKGAPYDLDATDSQPDVQIDAAEAADEMDEETDPEMRELLGLPPLPAPANMAGIHNRPPGVPAPAAPAAPALPKAPGSEPKPGTVDKGVFALIRQYVKMKDEDVAAGIGVSRQTFINYADPNKKATFVASDEQRAFLIKICTDARDALEEALNGLGHE